MRRLWVVLLLVSALVLTACETSRSVLYFDIRDHQYVMTPAKLLERTSDADVEARFGVLSDLHVNSSHDNLKRLVAKLRERDVEFIVVLGDTALNNMIQGYTEDVSDREELLESFRILGGTRLPILVMPGNHESQGNYYEALFVVEQEYDNIIDLTQLWIVDFDDVDFVIVPGYHDPNFMPYRGFLYGAIQLQEMEPLVSILDNPILLSHGPPRSEGAHAIDYVEGAGNVGDSQLNQFMNKNNIRFSLSGHIHEAGQRAVDSEANKLIEGEWYDTMWLNVAAGVDGKASIVTYAEGNIKYETVSLHE